MEDVQSVFLAGVAGRGWCLASSPLDLEALADVRRSSGRWLKPHASFPLRGSAADLALGSSVKVRVDAMSKALVPDNSTLAVVV